MTETEPEGEGTDDPIGEILGEAEIQKLQEIVQRFRQKFEAALAEFQKLIQKAIVDSNKKNLVLSFYRRNKDFLETQKEIGEIQAWEIQKRFSGEISVKLSYFDNIVTVVTRLLQDGSEFTLEDASQTVQAAEKLITEHGDQILDLKNLADRSQTRDYQGFFSNCYPEDWR